MARKHDYESWDTTRYSGNKCKFGHEGQVAKVTGLCAGCLRVHLAQGGYEWKDERLALGYTRPGSSTTPQEPSLEPERDRVRGKVILICGSRKWADKESIRRELASIEDVELVIHGAAPGADTLAGEVAHELGIPAREFPADWERYKPAMEYDPYTGKKKGNPAGPIRNQKMLREGQPDLVLAFTDELMGGTGHMVGIARKAGVEVCVHGLRTTEAPTVKQGAPLVASEG